MAGGAEVRETALVAGDEADTAPVDASGTEGARRWRPGRRRVAGVALLACAAGLVLWAVRPRPSTSTLIIGDSITWQAAGAGAFDDTPWEVASYPGATAELMVDKLGTRIAAGDVERLVVLLGTNDAADGDGWDARDEEIWTELLTLPPPSTCVVAVKPHLTDAADAGYREQVAQANRWLDERAGRQPNLWTVEWAPHAEQANVTDEDGIHLRLLRQPDPDEGPDAREVVTPEAAAARRAVIEEALALCDADPR